MKNDRKRQEILAKQRIEAMRKRRAMGTIQEESNDIVTDNDDRNSMQVDNDNNNKFTYKSQYCRITTSKQCVQKQSMIKRQKSKAELC